MKYSFVIILLFLSLVSLNSKATIIAFPGDTIIPSKHKFASEEVYVPKTLHVPTLINQFMEYLKDGKRTIGFLHEDEIAMIGEKKLTEKRLFFDSYKVCFWLC